MARAGIYPATRFERLLWWGVLAALSWGLFIGLFLAAKCLWYYCRS
jgi:hypothetical protein